MKKLFCVMLALLLMSVSLAACGSTGGNGGGAGNVKASSVTQQNTEFHKELEPVKYQEWEEVESVYYKTVFVNDEPYYEVQPVGEEPLQFPVADAVIYGVDDGENFVELVTMKLNGKEFSQYQLNVSLESAQEMPVVDQSGDAGVEDVGTAGTEESSMPNSTGEK